MPGRYFASPRNAAAQYNLGVLFLEEKSPSEAVDHFDAAVDLDPGFKMAHFQLANLLMTKGEFCRSPSPLHAGD